MGRPSRARASDTSGYAPRAMTFSLPSTRYFHRHSFEPAGLTRRYRPLPSLSLTGLAPGLAFLMTVSVSGMAGSKRAFFGDIPNRVPPYPQEYPQQTLACNRAHWTALNEKAPWIGTFKGSGGLFWTAKNTSLAERVSVSVELQAVSWHINGNVESACNPHEC